MKPTPMYQPNSLPYLRHQAVKLAADVRRYDTQILRDEITTVTACNRRLEAERYADAAMLYVLTAEWHLTHKDRVAL